MGRPVPFATSYMVGREHKRTNNRAMLPALKNNAAVGYKGSVKIEGLEVADLLSEKVTRKKYSKIVLVLNLLAPLRSQGPFSETIQ